MNPPQLKFIAAPCVDVTVCGIPFRVSAVTSLQPDSGCSKPVSFYLGVTRGSTDDERAYRFSEEHWGSLDEAHNAWWNGFTVDQSSPVGSVIALQLIADGSAIPLCQGHPEKVGKAP